MSTDVSFVPDQLPVLSRGKHKNPRKGACFMELASYLAGEPWSDHPACTQPLLAAVAREVNDHMSDEGRPRLAVLIPSVIGLISDDPMLDARIALLCARTALPVVAADRQRVLRVGIEACERMLDGRPPAAGLAPRRVEHLPYNAQWTYRFARRRSAASRSFSREIAPGIVFQAVEGISRACVPDPDQMLYDLLVAAIDRCRMAGRSEVDPPRAPDPAKWADACALTGLAAGA